ncbi:PAS domain-containing sensor histidine kinase [Ferruginibacter albus]|uniref:PAS domain-containing sensor histidine kinase n=1 Tax=Ferruginibacter albus TaxID=2875540 RepID=UPI001CC7A0EF|nr:PAS domain S-box protein [Ferruginibacter albus]UAY52776.1 PAS domain S-box protein [Ferruginibacter albus]
MEKRSYKKRLAQTQEKPGYIEMVSKPEVQYYAEPATESLVLIPSQPHKSKPDEIYRLLFENSPLAIFIWKLNDLKIVDVNDAAVKLSGYSRAELLGMNAADICPPNDRERLLKLTQKIIRYEHFKQSGIWRHITKQGKMVYADISSQKIIYNNNSVILNMATDITEKVMLEKKLTQERIQKQKEITQAAIIAQEKERAYLGAELHDNINQILATAYLYLDTSLVNESSRMILIKDSKEFIMSAIREIRRLSKTLSPPSLEATLADALESIVVNISLVNILKIKTEWSELKEDKIERELKLTIYRIVQEQLNNILKHAKASAVLITLKQTHNTLQLFIKDDGVGFSLSQKKEGVGLQNISSRAALHNGSVIINTKPGAGCELIVNFNLIKKEDSI